MKNQNIIKILETGIKLHSENNPENIEESEPECLKHNKNPENIRSEANSVINTKMDTQFADRISVPINYEHRKLDFSPENITDEDDCNINEENDGIGKENRVSNVNILPRITT